MLYFLIDQDGDMELELSLGKLRLVMFSQAPTYRDYKLTGSTLYEEGIFWLILRAGKARLVLNARGSFNDKSRTNSVC